MTPQGILKHAGTHLSQTQREQYFSVGFLAIPGAVSEEWVDRLRSHSDQFLDADRRFDTSDEVFDLGPEHTAKQPHVRRLRKLIDRHPDFWSFASKSALTDIATGLLGPDIKFHSSKLNYKWPGAGEVVKWHQDITTP